MTPVSRDLAALSDIPAALGLLSRLPVPVNGGRAIERGAAAAWAWPVAGAVLGTLAAAIGAIALWLGLAPPLAAGLVLITQVTMSGAMHEDGLADCADGFWGGWTQERRLEIMKDSHIGVYGVVALGLALILRWQALALILASGPIWTALIAVGMLSRAPMVAMMAGMRPARSGGLSQAVGQPSVTTAVLACGIAALASMALLGGLAVLLCLTLTAVGLIWVLLCRAKIGGQTGDTLGALQQLSEISALLVITAALKLG